MAAPKSHPTKVAARDRIREIVAALLTPSLQLELLESWSTPLARAIITLADAELPGDHTEAALAIIREIVGPADGASIYLAVEDLTPGASLDPATLCRAVHREWRTAELGPGWGRRVNGRDVSLEDVDDPPGRLRDPLVRVRCDLLRAVAPARERELLAVLEADPDSRDADHAEILGGQPSTARTLLERLRRRARRI